MNSPEPEKDNFARNEVRRTMLKIHILWRLTKSEVNAYSMLKEISEDNFAVSFFTDKRELRDDIYNSLKSLEKSELVVSSPKVEKGRLKQYYQITEKGRQALKSSFIEFQKGVKHLQALSRK